MTRGHKCWIVGVAMLFAGCEDIADPDGARGTYELVAANGADLPAVVFEGETEFGQTTATALSGTLTLRGARYTERVVFDVEVQGQPSFEFPVVVNGDYSTEGQILEFDPDDAAYPPFAGTLSGGVLTTVESSEFGQLELVWTQ